jgi:hypothetical protein
MPDATAAFNDSAPPNRGILTEVEIKGSSSSVMPFPSFPISRAAGKTGFTS